MPSLRSNCGVTLVELLVSLAVTAILLLIVVTGTLFVQGYVDRWRHRNSRAEETAFVANLLSDRLAACASVTLFPDSVVFLEDNRARACFRFEAGRLHSGRQALLRPGYRLEDLSITPFPPAKQTSDTISSAVPSTRRGLYRVRFRIADATAADTCELLVRNHHDYYQYAPAPAQ